MRYLNNAMATYEVNVASYYYKRGAYIAAANRAQGALVELPADAVQRGGARHPAQQLRRSSACRSSPTTREQILAKTFPDSTYVTGATDKPWWKFWSPRGHELRRAGDRPARDQAVVAVLGLTPGSLRVSPT